MGINDDLIKYHFCADSLFTRFLFRLISCQVTYEFILYVRLTDLPTQNPDPKWNELSYKFSTKEFSSIKSNRFN